MTDDTELFHYGILRRSGRYPWGSGATPEERGRSHLGIVEDLRRRGLSEVEIARGFGMSTRELRETHTLAVNEAHKADVAQALRLSNKGMSNVAIGKQMGINESSVRSLLKPAVKSRQDSITATANVLRDRIKETGGYLDIGTGTELHLDISSTKLAAAVAALREEGYQVRNIQVAQLGTGKKTTVKTLVPPGAPRFIDPSKIHTVAAFSPDGGSTYIKIEPPKNVELGRVGVRYAEQGGSKADGVIYVRPGVDDVSLGSSRYAQVRIAVNGTHYLKGMAMYSNDLPAGVDLLFNTNKHDTGNKLDAMKPQKTEDNTNPFGATIRQRYYTGKDGLQHLSPMNIVNEEGKWLDWSRSLSSQVLSKQSPALAKRQLGFALASRKDELAEIMRLTNPVVKKNLLGKFADGADSAAVHLKAAALPGQHTHVILPIQSLKPHEVYAPNYAPGTKVALVRFPHGGTFEIPELVVNNSNKEARGALSDSTGHARDAVGIHPSVAERLSGADFDGDAVLVIPNNRGDLHTSPPLKDLEHFDPKEMYGPYDGMRTIDGGTYNAKTGEVDYGGRKPSGRAKQTQMGDVSNLITDMTVKGARQDEIARAVRHSMVVIDAEKHHLNVKQSYIDNGIASLKERYQGRGATGRLAGASTIISRSGNASLRVPDRRLRRASEGGAIDPLTGEKVYVPTGEKFVDRHGRTVIKTTLSTPLGEVTDAHKLSSGTPIEEIYADHANALKALANQARKATLTVEKPLYSPSAARTYKSEVEKLNSDLRLALKNKPRERQAQLIANATIKAKMAANPGLEGDALKKLKGQELNNARARVGARKYEVGITDRQWQAIQAGAVSPSRLAQILEHANADRVRELATPRTATVVTPSKLAIAKARLAAGYTQADVAKSLGIPVTTLNSALQREGG